MMHNAYFELILFWCADFEFSNDSSFSSINSESSEAGLPVCRKGYSEVFLEAICKMVITCRRRKEEEKF